MSDASTMLKKLWSGYSDFITLDWLLRRLDNEPTRLCGVLLVAFALFILYEGVLGVHTGQSVNSTNRSGEMHSWYVTTESRVGYGCLAFTLGCIGLLFSLPNRAGRRSTAISIYGFSLLRRPLPLIGLIARYAWRKDVWLRVPCQPHPRVFAPGSVNPFPWYLTRKSRVVAKGIRAVSTFLAGCKYVADSEQFDHLDHWQHPVDFERRRQGDCEDHALWAWRKLCESGVDAEFLICRRKASEIGTGANHAMVLVHDVEGDFLLETVAKPPARIPLPLSGTGDQWLPILSVDRDFREWLYGGYLTRFGFRNNRSSNKRASQIRSRPRVQ